MSTPKNEIALNNEDNDNPRNTSNDQENAQSLESDLSGDFEDSIENGDQAADMESIDIASRASEAAYTLDVDNGIAPPPSEPNDEYNIKK